MINIHGSQHTLYSDPFEFVFLSHNKSQEILLMKQSLQHQDAKFLQPIERTSTQLSIHVQQATAYSQRRVCRILESTNSASGGSSRAHDLSVPARPGLFSRPIIHRKEASLSRHTLSPHLDSMQLNLGPGQQLPLQPVQRVSEYLI